MLQDTSALHITLRSGLGVKRAPHTDTWLCMHTSGEHLGIHFCMHMNRSVKCAHISKKKKTTKTGRQVCTVWPVAVGIREGQVEVKVKTG